MMWPAAASAAMAGHGGRQGQNRVGMGLPPPPPAQGQQGPGRSTASSNGGGDAGLAPTRRGSAKKAIEEMIRDYRLSPGCAWMMRALAPDKQKLAARIDPAGQHD